MNMDYALAKSWPFEEARKILSKVQNKNDIVLFETGYGPSGLPHIGTFGEVLRTTMVMNAFKRISGMQCRLIAFSDDMDGFRKVPDNVPNKEMLAQLRQKIALKEDLEVEKNTTKELQILVNVCEAEINEKSCL